VDPNVGLDNNIFSLIAESGIHLVSEIMSRKKEGEDSKVIQFLRSNIVWEICVAENAKKWVVQDPAPPTNKLPAKISFLFSSMEL
jgi:hypothetical protein